MYVLEPIPCSGSPAIVSFSARIAMIPTEGKVMLPSLLVSLIQAIPVSISCTMSVTSSEVERSRSESSWASRHSISSYQVWLVVVAGNGPTSMTHLQLYVPSTKYGRRQPSEGRRRSSGWEYTSITSDDVIMVLVLAVRSNVNHMSVELLP